MDARLRQTSAAAGLFRGGATRYMSAMKLPVPLSGSTIAKVALGGIVLAAATGVAFASWMDQGAGIFLAMVDAGLAWCF